MSPSCTLNWQEVRKRKCSDTMSHKSIIEENRRHIVETMSGFQASNSSTEPTGTRCWTNYSKFGMVSLARYMQRNTASSSWLTILNPFTRRSSVQDRRRGNIRNSKWKSLYPENLLHHLRLRGRYRKYSHQWWRKRFASAANISSWTR